MLPHYCSPFPTALPPPTALHEPAAVSAPRMDVLVQEEKCAVTERAVRRRMAGIPPSFLKRNIRKMDGKAVPSRGTVFVQVNHCPKLEDVSTSRMGYAVSERKILPVPKISSLMNRNVVTPIAAEPPWNGAPKHDALLTREAEARKIIAQLEGRVYLPALRRHFVTTLETAYIPCLLKFPYTRRQKVRSRACN